MVGLVIVSHSRALADALIRLVKQVSGQDVPIAVAAGIGPDRQEIGTDAVEIAEAIQSVDSPDGVVVLMDLGSAILSAEMALDLLPTEIRSHIRFCAAPLVEGAISAAVQAGLTNDMETICREARDALLPKAQQLGQLAGGATAEKVKAPAPAIKEPPSEEVILRLQNAHGLHARPAARFVKMASGFDAKIQVKNLTKEKGPVPANSLNALATLGAVHGDEISISANGREAGAALKALSELVSENFGEVIEAEPVPPSAMPATVAPEGALQAVPVSEGIAIGPLFLYRLPPPPVPDTQAEDPGREWDRLEQAIRITQRKLQNQRNEVAADLGEKHAAIFDAHLLILEDPELLARTRELIFQKGANAAKAWHQAIGEVAGAYRNLEDLYLQQRATDVVDVGNQVLYALSGKEADSRIEIPEPAVLFAPELTPTQTARLPMDQILGIMTISGGPTSHSAILARAMGIPAVSGAEASIEALPAGTTMGLDGFEGRIWVDPPEKTRVELGKRRAGWLKERAELLRKSSQPAVTRDGHAVEVAANVGNLLDAETAIKNGAEAVGLLRTEFLFLTRETPPSEEEQLAALRQIVGVMQSRPVIVRTLDVGGDKALPYLGLPGEANPFLGVRAIRLSLREPDLFRTQLRAILRAGEGAKLRVMFPMVANVEEVDWARRLLEEVHQSLAEEGLAHLWPIDTGIMVEIPAAALLSPKMAGRVDFFSIGTNDLTQYTLAAERGNPALTALSDALHPAVLGLIKQVVNAAHQRKKWVGVCGELAGDPVAIPVLVGLGVDELSMNPGAIPRGKDVLRSIDYAGAQDLAERLLQCQDAAEARKLAAGFIQDSPSN